MSGKILSQLPRVQITPKGFKSLPQSPGVYLFLKGDVPVYIGKAVNLKARLSSYLQKNIGPKTRSMVGQSGSLGYLLVSSELESLILEAELIREFKPTFNSVSKDDKHALYIKITKEEYPRVLTARKIEGKDTQAFFGPFPSSTKVRQVLRFLRKIFPYADHKPTKRKCLDAHIGLCNPCPSEIEAQTKNEKTKLRKLYLRNIRLIKNVLSRKTDKVLSSLYREMQLLARKERFEEAALVREQIRRLEYILQPINPAESFIENPNLLEDVRAGEEKSLRRILNEVLRLEKPLKRVECFDVAHLAGARPTASMVTFIGGEPEKNLYRHYRIRQTKGFDDIASLREVAERRLKSLKTIGLPDLIIVDGGRGQVSVFARIFYPKGIPVVGLEKRFETLVIPSLQGRTIYFNKIRVPVGPGLNFLQRIRDEAHRFARRYHHLLLKKGLVS